MARLLPALAAALLLAAGSDASGREKAKDPLPGSAAGSDSEGFLLVLNKQDDTLMMFDEPSHRSVATIPVGHEPHEVAATPDGRKAFVSNVGDDTVSVVDLVHRKVATTIHADHLDQPHGLAVTPDGRTLLVTSEASQIGNSASTVAFLS